MMTTLCIQCLMEAMLLELPPPVIEESPEEHMRRVHPDPEATAARRRELELALEDRIAREKARERSPR